MKYGDMSMKHLTAGEKVSKKYRRAMIRKAEYLKLKAIVPAVARKKAVSKLMVIEEAIRYIDELHEALAKKMNGNEFRHSTGHSECRADVIIHDLCGHHKMFSFTEPIVPALLFPNSTLSSSSSSPPPPPTSLSFFRTPLADVQLPRFLRNCEMSEESEDDDDDENEALLPSETV